MVIQAFRDNIPKWLTGIILVLIIGPFALWGINSYFSASGDTSVAKVNGTEIAPQAFQQAYQGRYQQLEQMLGAAFKPGLINEKELRQEVLRQLVNETLLDQQVAKQRYMISDADLVAAVQGISAFQVGGKFSSQVYQATLANVGMTPAGFEKRELQGLAVGQLQKAIESSAFATPQEFAVDAAVKDELRQIAYVTVSAKRFMDQVNSSDADVAAYYRTHNRQFMTPEKLTLAYVDLDEAQLAKRIKASTAKLDAMYQQQIASFRQEASRKAQHILIAVQGNGPKADGIAKAKAEAILKQLRAGAKFSGLAEKYSDDAGSAKRGGDLGWITRGTMNKPFEKLLFGIAKVGDIAGPVRLSQGYDIVKLDGIRAPSVEPFDRVRTQLLAEYQQKKAENEYYTLGDQLANLAYEHPDSLQTVSQRLNLPIETLADVTRTGGTGIAANPAVRKKAFSDAVLKQGTNSDPIQIGPHHVVVIRVQAHVASERKPLAVVHDRIVGILKRRQADQLALRTAEAVETAIKSGQDAAQVAKRYAAVYVPAKFVGRTDASVPAPVLAAAFVASRPVNRRPVIGRVALGGGSEAVFALTGVKPGSVSGLTKTQRLTQMQELNRLNAETEFAAYLANLRQQAKIAIHLDNIQE